MADSRLHQGIKGIAAVILSLAVVFSIASCSVPGSAGNAEETHIGRTTNSSRSKREKGMSEPTDPDITGTPQPSVPDNVVIDYDYIKDACVYSVWYDVETDNPADSNVISSDKAYALKGVFYFNTPLTTTVEAKLYKDDEAIITKQISLKDSYTNRPLKAFFHWD